ARRAGVARPRLGATSAGAADDALDRDAGAWPAWSIPAAGRACVLSRHRPARPAANRGASGRLDVPRPEADCDRPPRASAWLASGEDDVVREQSRVKGHEPAGDEMELRLLEPRQERADSGA